MHIAVLGIGGVGGYLGGLLAEKYCTTADVRISFLASPATAAVIHEIGLEVRLPDRTIVAHPNLVTAYPQDCAPVDLLIVCVKSYDLEQSVTYWKSCIHHHTRILPLLNGIDATERLQEIFPGNEILYGCMYLVAKKIAPGIIEQTGAVQSMHFGPAHNTRTSLQQLETLLRDAGINATLEKDIRSVAWKKFVFIAAVASITSGLNQTLGVIRNAPTMLNLLLQLLAEITTIAHRTGVQLPDNIIHQTLETIHRLPPETTSSMQRDILQGNRSEVQSLTGKVVELGLRFQVPTPAFNELLRMIESRDFY